MAHSADSDKLLKVAGNELGAVVRDDSWVFVRELLPVLPKSDFRVCLGHCLPDFPVHMKVAVSIQNAAEIIECTPDIEIRNICVPVAPQYVKHKLLTPYVKGFAG